MAFSERKFLLSLCFRSFLIAIMLISASTAVPFYYSSSSFAYPALSKAQSDNGPVIKDHNLKAEIVLRGGGLKFPTSMAFLGPNDILVLEKNEGTVKRIVNGVMLPKPLLDVNVANKNERGMLGIAVAPPKQHDNKPTYVFLYYTEALTKDGDDVTEGKAPLGNRLYRCELIDNKLVNPKLLLDLPAAPAATHNGGAILMDHHDNIYLPIGNVNDHEILSFQTKAQNSEKAADPNGTSGILRINEDGKPVNKKGNNILGNKYPLNLYYAYGIRNSFGIDFDPVTGNLWDTENGPFYGDEINLVKPGFNSGWNKVQGIWKPNGGFAGKVTLHPANLLDFNSKGRYSDPEFTWHNSTGVTALKFLNSDKLGKQYQNDMFVGDFHRGNLYHFDLDKKRTGLSLGKKGEPLHDKIANNTEELNKVLFGEGFGGITDIEVGPDDGYLYILSLYQGGDNCNIKDTPNYNNNKANCISYSSSSLEGTIFRIAPTTN
jgi:aldose sugar dehydrogenase